MTKPLWELELSSNLQERELFVQKLKDRIKESEEVLATINPWQNLDRELFIRLSKDADSAVAEMAQKIIRDCDAYFSDEAQRKVVEHEQSFLAMLKKKLDSFDIYNQNVSYACSRCKESTLLCVCDELIKQR